MTFPKINKLLSNMRAATHVLPNLGAHQAGEVASHISPAPKHGVDYMSQWTRDEMAKAEAAAHFDLECDL